MSYKRILTMQDISCVGQCSLTVALPILAACGHEVCILPTAVLSSHTGGFHNPHIRNLSEDVPAICACWKRENIDFDYIYTGYLGSAKEIAYALRLTDEMLAADGRLIVDPAMADHGKLYQGFDDEYAKTMKQLCDRADVLIPNITEAAMLTGLDYRENYDEAYISQLICGLNVPRVVLTGVSYKEGQTGVVVAENGDVQYYVHRRIGNNYHGTGDMFASALVGALASGKELSHAARIAADYTCKCIENTFAAPAHWYGVKFETALPDLIAMLKT